MAFMRKTKDGDQIEGKLAGMRTRKSALQAKLGEAERVLAQAIESRRKTLLESDDEQTAGTKAVVGHLRDQRDAISDALATLNDQITAAEGALTQERDRVQRAAAAAELTALAETLAGTINGFTEAAGKMVAAIPAVTSRVPLANSALAMTMGSIFSDLARELQTLIATARAHAERITTMGADVVTPREAPPPAPPPAPRGEHVNVLVFQNSKWTENGETQTCARFGVAHLPAALAARVVEAKFGTPENSDWAKRLRETESSDFGAWHRPAADLCVDLDAPVLHAPPGALGRTLGDRSELDDPPSASPVGAIAGTEHTGPARTGVATIAR